MLRQIRYICGHPLCRDRRVAAVRRFIAWQIRSRLHRGPITVPFTRRTTLLVSRGMTGATGNIYCGLHEFEDMAFVLHLLRPGDRFADVGANIGSYTVLASGHAGAHTTAFEPVPDTFAALTANIKANGIESLVDAHFCGIGAEPGVLRFTVGMDTMNHIATEEDRDAATQTVTVQPLDAMLAAAPPLCMKIDVEGYETNVIRGGRRVLASPHLRAVLMELNGSGARYGFSDDELRCEMADAGFVAHAYEPFTRTLTPLGEAVNRSGNTLFLRDRAFIDERLRTAPAIELPWTTVPRGAR